MNIILVHGIFDTNKVFKKTIHTLTLAGHRCIAPSLQPANAKYGIKNLSIKLDQYINQAIGDDEPFVLVGFSMGCLVSRYYLQEIASNKHCKAFHAISGPHHGSWWAYLYWGQGAIDMRANSEFLKSLKQSEDRLQNMPVYSYRTPYDLMILPSTSSVWNSAENHIVKAPLHRLMVRQAFIVNKILESIAD